MSTSNNAFNLPLSNGQIIVGSTGGAPVATNITASGTATVTNGPGTVDINSKTWNVVNLTSAPAQQISPVNNTLYAATAGTYTPSSGFILNPFSSGVIPRQIGEIFTIVSNAAPAGLTIACDSATTRMAFANILYTAGAFSVTSVSNIEIVYMGIVFGLNIYQILSHDSVTLS